MGTEDILEINCFICGIKLTPENRAKRENGEYRNDAFNNAWCSSCTDKHDCIDWDWDIKE